MKWFKHQSNARNDKNIAALEDLSGLEGYGFYFKLLEILAENLGESGEFCAEYSVNSWAKKMNILPGKFKKLIENCIKTELIYVEKYTKTDEKLSKNSSELYKITSPNLLKNIDNHTRNLQVTCKQDKDKDKDKDRDKDLIEKTTAQKMLEDAGVQKTLAADFLKIRKTKLTKTALDGLAREADKAGIQLSDAVRICVERGWQSFSAAWEWGPDRKPRPLTRTELNDAAIAAWLAEDEKIPGRVQ